MEKELIKILEFLGNSPLWLYFILMVLFFYGVIALFTWSFVKPLKLLGVPSIIGGIIIIGARFLLGLISVNSLIDSLIPSLLQPLLTIGIVCVVMGFAMLIGNHFLKKVLSKKVKTVNNELIEEQEKDLEDSKA